MRRAGSRGFGSRGGSAKRGFTLLELVLTLVVIALVAAWAIPSWFDRPEVTLDRATELLAADLREAQNRAAFEETRYRVEFAADGDGYRVLDEGGAPARAPLGGGPFARQYSRDAVFRGVRLAAVDFEGAREVGFDANGQVDRSGTVVVVYGGAARVVRVHGTTGLVEVEGMDAPFRDDGR